MNGEDSNENKMEDIIDANDVERYERDLEQDPSADFDAAVSEMMEKDDDEESPLSEQELQELQESAMQMGGMPSKEDLQMNSFFEAIAGGKTQDAIGGLLQVFAPNGPIEDVEIGDEDSMLHVKASGGVMTIVQKHEMIFSCENMDANRIALRHQYDMMMQNVREMHSTADLESEEAIAEIEKELEKELLHQRQRLGYDIAMKARAGALPNAQGQENINAMLSLVVLTDEDCHDVLETMYADAETRLVGGQVLIHNHTDTPRVYSNVEYIEPVITYTESDGDEIHFNITFTNTVELLDHSLDQADVVVFSDELAQSLSLKARLAGTVTVTKTVFETGGEPSKLLLTGFRGKENSYMLIEFLNAPAKQAKPNGEWVEPDHGSVYRASTLFRFLLSYISDTAVEARSGEPSDAEGHNWDISFSGNHWHADGKAHSAVSFNMTKVDPATLPNSDVKYQVNFQGSFRNQGSRKGMAILNYLPILS